MLFGIVEKYGYLPPATNTSKADGIGIREGSGKGMEFCEHLKEERKRSRKTQAEMADLLAVTRETYAAYEKGTRFPTVDKLKQICETLDCSADHLLELDEPEAQEVYKAYTLQPLIIQNSLRRVLHLPEKQGAIICVDFETGQKKPW